MKKNSLIITIVLIFLTGCQTILPKKETPLSPYVNVQFESNKSKSNLELLNINTHESNNLLQFNIQLYNTAYFSFSGNYKVFWFDKNDIPVSEDIYNWTPFSITSRGQINIKKSAINEKATYAIVSIE